jgi:hypothetical protein
MDAHPIPTPPYRSAALAGALTLGLYALTLAPTTALWDASEYIATAHILGIPHPPGNALFVVLGRAWSILLAPLGLPVAVRINLLAAATSAGAAFFYFLIAHRVMVPVTGSERVRRVAAGVSVLLGATAYTVWNQSTVNEKVYTISVLIIAAVVWLALRWRDHAGTPRGDRALLWAVYLVVLGTTNHLMSALPVPAVALFVLATAPATLLRTRLWVRAVPLVLLGLSFNLFLPVRAAQDPVINEGDPTCEAVGPALAAVWTNGQVGCADLGYSLRREQYQKPPVSQRMAPLGHQLLNWYQYFDWQWARGLDPSELPGTARTPLTLLFGLLGVLGLWTAARGDPRSGLLLGVLTVTLTVGLVYYLNFRYGYSLAPEVTDRVRHEVRERDYFFIAGFGLWGVLAGLGLTRAWLWLAGVVGGGDGGAGDGRGLGIASPVLLLAALPLVLNWGWASRAGDYAARDWAWNLLVSAEPYAILFTNGDNDTFPLWYLQEVEGVRPDVTVAVAQYLYTPWYPVQLQELTDPQRQRRYDPAGPGSFYPDRPAPTRPVTELAPAVVESLAGGRLAERQTVTFPELAVRFPEGMYLSRGEQLALRFIVESYTERPVYFTSAAGLANDLGLARFLVREGLLHRLDIRPLESAERPALVQGSPAYGGEWFNLERSVELWEERYSFRGLRDREVWFDRATLNIPWHFYALAVQLSDVVGREGDDPERVERLLEEARAFEAVALGGRRGQPAPPEAAGGGEETGAGASEGG